MKELKHEGSVKDIYQENEQELIFHFSDRYSIFDWGKMPNEIPGKGEALADMGAVLLQELQAAGIPTHFVRRNEDRREFVVKSVHVPRGDLSIYATRPKQILIPIEFIYRFGVPKGSSLLKKFPLELDWIQAGYDRLYREGEFFKNMSIDFTTKLEPIDRELKKEEVVKLAGLNEAEFDEAFSVIRKTAHYLQARFQRVGLTLWDGKVELAFDQNRKVILVDSIGLDEMRLTFEKKPLSKEVLRQFYVTTDWYKALLEAKKESPQLFRNYCERVLRQSPKALPESTIHAVSSLYQSVTRILKARSEAEIKSVHESIRNAFHTFEVKP